MFLVPRACGSSLPTSSVPGGSCEDDTTGHGGDLLRRPASPSRPPSSRPLAIPTSCADTSICSPLSPYRTGLHLRGGDSHIFNALVRHLTQLTVMFLVIHGVYLAFPLSQCPQSIFTLLSVVFSGTVLVLLNLLSKFIATVQITYIGTFPISCS